jgi:hypothetical protein
MKIVVAAHIAYLIVAIIVTIAREAESKGVVFRHF